MVYCSSRCVSWPNDAAEVLSSEDVPPSVFVVRRRPTRAKKIEIRPSATITPAPIPTVLAELPAKPINVIPAPRKAMPRTSRRQTRNLSDLREAALGTDGPDGTLPIPQLRFCLFIASPNRIGEIRTVHTPCPDRKGLRSQHRSSPCPALNCVAQCV